MGVYGHASRSGLRGNKLRVSPNSPSSSIKHGVLRRMDRVPSEDVNNRRAEERAIRQPLLSKRGHSVRSFIPHNRPMSDHRVIRLPNNYPPKNSFKYFFAIFFWFVALFHRNTISRYLPHFFVYSLTYLPSRPLCYRQIPAPMYRGVSIIDWLTIDNEDLT